MIQLTCLNRICLALHVATSTSEVRSSKTHQLGAFADIFMLQDPSPRSRQIVTLRHVDFGLAAPYGQVCELDTHASEAKGAVFN